MKKLREFYSSRNPRAVLLASAVLVILIAAAFYQEGTASKCDNYHGTAPEHKCECAKAMKCPEPGKPLEESKNCKTYCRKQDCHCIGPCES